MYHFAGCRRARVPWRSRDPRAIGPDRPVRHASRRPRPGARYRPAVSQGTERTTGVPRAGCSGEPDRCPGGGPGRPRAGVDGRGGRAAAPGRGGPRGDPAHRCWPRSRWRRRGAPAGRVVAVTATGREAEDLAEALRSYLPAASVADFPAWETLPHERLSPRSDTVGRRLAVLRRLAHPSADDPATGPVQVLVAADPGADAAGDPRAGGPGAGAAARRRRGRPRAGRRRPRRCRLRRGWTWSSGAASSPSGAASSTSSRPPRTTRCGSSSGATRSRRSAGSRSPTSASLEVAERGLWAPACREILLTDVVRERAAALVEQLPGGGRHARQDRGRASRSRAWSRWRRCSSTACSRCSTWCRPARTSCVLDPERVRGRAARPDGDQRGVPRRVLGERGGGQRRRRSTSARRPTGRWPRCALTPARSACPGGR